MTLQGGWNLTDIKHLVRIMDMHQYFYYNICWNEDTIKKITTNLRRSKEQHFNAMGRWSFQNNLESFFDVLDPQYMDRVYKAVHSTPRQIFNSYYYLLKNMKERELTIHWSYTDEEAGNGYLYTQIGYHSITAKFQYNVSSYQTYTYNLKNYCAVYLEGDDEPVYEAAFNLSKLFNIPQESIVELIKKHETWYDLGTCYFSDTAEEFINRYPELHKDIIALNKSGVTDAS